MSKEGSVFIYKKGSLLIGLVLFLACNFNSGEESYVKNAELKEQASSDTSVRDSLVKNWKEDSLGCLKLRSRKNAERILSSFSSREINKQFLLENFGTPNKVKRDTEQEVFVYYYGTMCQNGKIIESSDKCYLSFHLTVDTMNKKIYLCE